MLLCRVVLQEHKLQWDILLHPDHLSSSTELSSTPDQNQETLRRKWEDDRVTPRLKWRASIFGFRSPECSLPETHRMRFIEFWSLRPIICSQGVQILQTVQAQNGVLLWLQESRKLARRQDPEIWNNKKWVETLVEPGGSNSPGVCSSNSLL